MVSGVLCVGLGYFHEEIVKCVLFGWSVRCVGYMYVCMMDERTVHTLMAVSLTPADTDAINERKSYEYSSDLASNECLVGGSNDPMTLISLASPKDSSQSSCSHTH